MASDKRKVYKKPNLFYPSTYCVSSCTQCLYVQVCKEHIWPQNLTMTLTLVCWSIGNTWPWPLPWPWYVDLLATLDLYHDLGMLIYWQHLTMTLVCWSISRQNLTSESWNLSSHFFYVPLLKKTYFTYWFAWFSSQQIKIVVKLGCMCTCTCFRHTVTYNLHSPFTHLLV